MRTTKRKIVGPYDVARQGGNTRRRGVRKVWRADEAARWTPKAERARRAQNPRNA